MLIDIELLTICAFSILCGTAFFMIASREQPTCPCGVEAECEHG